VRATPLLAASSIFYVLLSEYASPAFGSYGAGAVLQAAAFLDGQPVFETDDEEQPEPTDY
jgi:hypothetical protein